MAERPLPKEQESEREGPLWELSLSLPDGTTTPTTLAEAQGVFCNFPRAETPEELAKIQARRMAGGCTGDDDEPASNDSD